MRIAKPLLLITTPLGVAGGLWEGYRLGGGLVIPMAAMVVLLSTAAAGVVGTIRREQREQAARAGVTEGGNGS